MTAALIGPVEAVDGVLAAARRMNDTDRERLHQVWGRWAGNYRRRQILTAFRVYQALPAEEGSQHLVARADAYVTAHRQGSPWPWAAVAVADAVFAVLAGDGLTCEEWWMFAGPFRQVFPDVALPEPDEFDLDVEELLPDRAESSDVLGALAWVEGVLDGSDPAAAVPAGGGGRPGAAGGHVGGGAVATVRGSAAARGV